MPNKLQVIQQGESLPFSFDRGGESLDDYICTIFVKEFPNGSVLITRVIPLGENELGEAAWVGFLTSTETAALAVSLFYLTGKLTNSLTDEEEQVPIRFKVSKVWA